MKAKEESILKLKINRDSVCLADDINNHEKVYEVDDNATYEDLFNLLKSDHYCPTVFGNNEVWVLTSQHCNCIFSYFVKTNKLSRGLSESSLESVCGDFFNVFLKYYSSPLKWKEHIYKMYNGDEYSLWKYGWRKEIEYCDYVESKKKETLQLLRLGG